MCEAASERQLLRLKAQLHMNTDEIAAFQISHAAAHHSCTLKATSGILAACGADDDDDARGGPQGQNTEEENLLRICQLIHGARGIFASPFSASRVFLRFYQVTHAWGPESQKKSVHGAPIFSVVHLIFG